MPSVSMCVTSRMFRLRLRIAHVVHVFEILLSKDPLGIYPWLRAHTRQIVVRHRHSQVTRLVYQNTMYRLFDAHIIRRFAIAI